MHVLVDMLIIDNTHASQLQYSKITWIKLEKNIEKNLNLVIDALISMCSGSNENLRDQGTKKQGYDYRRLKWLYLCRTLSVSVENDSISKIFYENK